MDTESLFTSIKFSRPCLIIVLFIMIMFGQCQYGYSQEEVQKVPELNEHVFLPISSIKAPFTNTTFGMKLGIGSTINLTIPLPEIGDLPIEGIDGNVMFASLGLNYSQRIRKRLAMYLKFKMSARIGTDVGSIINLGLNTVTTTQLGWIINLLETEKSFLSGTVDLYSYTGLFINVSKFVEDIVNGVPNPSLTDNVPALSAGIGLRYAYAFSSIFGMKLNGVLSYGESFDRNVTSFRYNLGFAFDANFNEKHNVPIGLGLSYNLLSNPDIIYFSDSFASAGMLKIAYTGSSDFSLGVEASILSLPQEDMEKRPIVQLVAFSLIYFFN